MTIIRTVDLILKPGEIVEKGMMSGYDGKWHENPRFLVLREATREEFIEIHKQYPFIEQYANEPGSLFYEVSMD